MAQLVVNVCILFCFLFLLAPRTLKGSQCWIAGLKGGSVLGTLVGKCSLNHKKNLPGVKEQQVFPVREPLWCRFRKRRMSVKRKRQTTRREREMAEGGERVAKKKKKQREKESKREKGNPQVDWLFASLSEVHGVLGVIVDLDCLGQRLRVPAVTLA